MKRLIIAAAMLLSLSGCGALSGLMLPAAPAPLAKTTIDDRGLDAAWKAFDVALDAINALGDEGVIVPGSPRGRALAAAVRRVNKALAAAERFAAAGSTSEYAEALREAAAGFTEIRAIIKGEN